MVLYFGVALAALGVVGPEAMGREGAALRAAMRHVAPVGPFLVSLGALFATSTVMLTEIWGISRLIFAMARETSLAWLLRDHASLGPAPASVTPPLSPRYSDHRPRRHNPPGSEHAPVDDRSRIRPDRRRPDRICVDPEPTRSSRDSVIRRDSSLLFLLYPAIRPFSDETSVQGAAAFASTAWMVVHMSHGWLHPAAVGGACHKQRSARERS